MSGLDTRIFRRVYVPLGDVWDIVALINSAVNFLLYCSMSRNFRFLESVRESSWT